MSSFNQQNSIQVFFDIFGIDNFTEEITDVEGSIKDSTEKMKNVESNSVIESDENKSLKVSKFDQTLRIGINKKSPQMQEDLTNCDMSEKFRMKWNEIGKQMETKGLFQLASVCYILACLHCQKYDPIEYDQKNHHHHHHHHPDNSGDAGNGEDGNNESEYFYKLNRDFLNFKRMFDMIETTNPNISMMDQQMKNTINQVKDIDVSIYIALQICREYMNEHFNSNYSKSKSAFLSIKNEFAKENNLSLNIICDYCSARVTDLKKKQTSINELNSVIKTYPMFAFPYNDRTIQLAKQGKVEHLFFGLKLLNKSIALLPTFYHAHVNRGNIYKRIGKFDMARENYSKAIELNPYFSTAYTGRAILSILTLTNVEQAIADCHKAIEVHPSSAFAYNTRGMFYHYCVPSVSAKMFSDLSKLGSDTIRNIVFGFNERHTFPSISFDRAIRDYSKAIELDPNYMEAYFKRGLIYNSKGDAKEAIQDFSKVIRFCQEKSIRERKLQASFYHRASNYVKLSNYTKAMNDLNTAIQLDKMDHQALELRSYLHKEIFHDAKKAAIDTITALKIRKILAVKQSMKSTDKGLKLME